ncbi:MAG: oxidoreductase [Rhodospirillaceae bacterium]|nr:oxidoreductase [Rhodospirillaceae bacterium]MDD9913659.1 oxidoreductase [Rhodospirillaceae bacterium]MDD9927080.1 oxidoreductase [Rhodospirillaceae bacterium]
MAVQFPALVLTEDDGKVSSAVRDMSVDELPEGDVTVRVTYSGLNYKDGMIINGIGRLVRDYPHVPGIDFAGVVEESGSDRYKPGDRVILTGWRVGEVHWGGYAGKARVKSDWLVPMPEGLTDKRAMAIGTAGFTSMLCVAALEDHGLTPDAGTVLVTGAAGGVGSVAVSILAKRGYTVAASTGRAEQADYLTSLGASQIIDRAELSEPSKRPLESENFAGAVDTVGGTTLARVLAQTAYGGSVAACGLAGGANLECTVLPFLLRGVNLLGIDSVMQPYDNRVRVWQRLVDDLPMDRLDALTEEIGLSDLPQAANDILKGQVRGRLVVKL